MNLSRSLRAFLFALSCTLGMTSTALGAVLCVDASDATCYSTINLAIAAAAPGDTIEVAAGIYTSPLIIPVGLTGLTVTGASTTSVIIDAGGPTGGNGITVRAPAVTIENVTIRNAESHGIEILAGVTDTHITNVAVLHAAGGNSLLVDTGANRTVVQGSSFIGADDSCVFVRGNAFSMSNSVVRQCAASGIELLGDTPTVLRNQISVCVEDGIFAGGPAVTVSENSVTSCGQHGISVEAGDLAVDANVVTASGDTGIDIACSTCEGSSASFNRISDLPSDAMAARGGAAGLVVERNTIKRASDSGLSVEGTGVFVSRNSVAEAGQIGIEIEDDVHVVSDNLTKDTGDDGFRIEATDLDVVRNRAVRAGRDGFDVKGGSVNVRLIGNQTSLSDAEGFDVSTSASVTRLGGNVSNRDRTDFCDDGTTTVDIGGNSFVFPGVACLID